MPIIKKPKKYWRVDEEDVRDFALDMGQRIRKYRELKWLSQLDLALMLGLESRSSVDRWESGATSPLAPNIKKLAQALGVPIERLFYD